MPMKLDVEARLDVEGDDPTVTQRRRRSSSIVVAADQSVHMESYDSVGAETSECRMTSCTLYLIRHGEAEHNVREKAAQAAAKAEAVERGLDPNGAEVAAAMETARKAVLQDCALCDPPLSDAGKAMAAVPRKALDQLYGRGLPQPTCVLVSPLQRTLQTAALVFPGHGHVMAREALKERQTRLACDTRSSADELLKRGTFKHMNLSEIVRHDDEGHNPTKSASGGADVEDKEMLRSRTLQVLELLEEQCDHRAVAIVSHKGYIRELERGPFCRSEATECGNGEVRVYSVTVVQEAGGSRRVLADRVHPRDAADITMKAS